MHSDIESLPLWPLQCTAYIRLAQLDTCCIIMFHYYTIIASLCCMNVWYHPQSESIHSPDGHILIRFTHAESPPRMMCFFFNSLGHKKTVRRSVNRQGERLKIATVHVHSMKGKGVCQFGQNDACVQESCEKKNTDWAQKPNSCLKGIHTGCDRNALRDARNVQKLTVHFTDTHPKFVALVLVMHMENHALRRNK